MKGNKRVTTHLQRLVIGELTARDQYLMHARVLEDAGFAKLAARTERAMQAEAEHLDILIRRMLFLGARPELAVRDEIKVGATVPEMLRNDLELEYRLTDLLRSAIECAAEEHDYQSQVTLAALLSKTEEAHAYWLEQQLGLIEALGLQNYLSAQL